MTFALLLVEAVLWMVREVGGGVYPFAWEALGKEEKQLTPTRRLCKYVLGPCTWLLDDEVSGGDGHDTRTRVVIAMEADSL